MIRIISLSACFVLLCEGFRDLDSWKIEEGKRQYEVVEKNMNMPKYGQCWSSTAVALQSSCKDVTDEEQTRLALAYLNCFLMGQGRKTYRCDSDDSLQDCTKDLSDSDRSSLTTFFTHTHNICYFLQAQVWHENTENVINRLSSRSEEVALKLDESSNLQHEIIIQQNKSLINQKIILNQAENLSTIINESKNSVQDLFTEFQKTTQEQRKLLSEIFDRMARIHTTILGEHISLFSVLTYTAATIFCYLLTSTARTHGARLPLFALIILNILLERQIHAWLSSCVHDNLSRKDEADQNDTIYRYQWLCRQISSVCGFVILLLYGWRYQDIHAVNNQHLLDIKQQLRQALDVLPKRDEETRLNPYNGLDDLGYESNKNIDTIRRKENTESTQNRPVVDYETDTESESSFSTALTGLPRSKRASVELVDANQVEDNSGFTAMKERIYNWAATGSYVREICPENLEVEEAESRTAAKQKKGFGSTKNHEPAAVKRYNLRQRKQRM